MSCPECGSDRIRGIDQEDMHSIQWEVVTSYLWYCDDCGVDWWEECY